MHDRRPMSGRDSSVPRSQNDMRDGQLHSVDATEASSLSPQNTGLVPDQSAKSNPIRQFRGPNVASLQRPR